MEPNLQDMARSDGVSVHTGFPNPGLDQRNRDQQLALNINDLLVKRPTSTYLFRITGHHWAEQGIFDGDIAVIDRALTPRVTDLVVTWQGDTFGLERQLRRNDQERPWGVVTAVIHQFDRK